MFRGELGELVLPGLVPGIHVLKVVKAWMAGTSPAMTKIYDSRGNRTPFTHQTQ
jgi:hypothetical protein